MKLYDTVFYFISGHGRGWAFSSTDLIKKFDRQQIDNVLSDLVKDICLLIGAIFIEWAQYIDQGFGCICFQNERINVIWEEFPNNLSFELDSISNAELLLEKLV